MQEDSLEEFWWDEFVALTVEESEERKSAYSRSRQFLYRDLVRNTSTCLPTPSRPSLVKETIIGESFLKNGLLPPYEGGGRMI